MKLRPDEITKVLRDQIELHRRIADSLLARWGLYAAEE